MPAISFSRAPGPVAAYQRCDMIKILADTSTKICGRDHSAARRYNTCRFEKLSAAHRTQDRRLISVTASWGLAYPASSREVAAFKIWLLSGQGLQVTDDILIVLPARRC